MALPRPRPTNPPSARGLNQYFQGSSATDPRYSNYVNTSPMSNPSNQVNAYGTPLYQGSVLGARTTPIVQTNPYTGEFLQSTDDLGGGGTGDDKVPDPNPQPSEFDRMVELARAAYESALRDADYELGRAKGVRDEGIGMLNKRRGEFHNLFNEGRDTILDRYEGERGNLQASDQGARTRMSNALRAMGLGGSAFIKSEGRQTQNAAKALGGLQTQRNDNENANTRERDSRLEWADTQEGGLNRFFQDAVNARRSLGDKSSLVMQGDVNAINQSRGDYLGKILQNQQAIAAAQGGISGYTANPYAVNISSMEEALNGAVPQVGQMGASGVQNVNLQEQDPTLALLKRRSGVGGAGLYA